MFKTLLTFFVFVSSCIICKGCVCHNSLLGTAQEALGEPDYTCEFNKWCFVPCDGSCPDIQILNGFFKGHCKSGSACDSDNTPTSPETPDNPPPEIVPTVDTSISPERPGPPPPEGVSAAVCECLDPNGSQCFSHQKCFVLCNTCPDQTKNKRGRCVSEKACQ